MFTKEQLITSLIKDGYLKTSIIIEAFKNINRADFVLPEFKDDAYLNVPLPIGYGQTISQPLTVAFMLELLEPKPGQMIMDIGSGSGWQTALLACIVSQKRNSKSQIPNLKPRSNPFEMLRGRQISNSKTQTNQINGKVFAVERIPELYEFGKKNIAKYNFIEKRIVECFCLDGSAGLKEIAEKIGGFDRIVAAASAQDIPAAWKEQLKIGGRLLIPVEYSIILLEKISEKDFSRQEFFGFSFVPLIEDN